MAKHKYAEVIKQWADDQTKVIECRHRDTEEWKVVYSPSWFEDTQYRVKPEHIYPETKMSETELCLTFQGKGLHYGLRDIANAAIRHAIDAGQVAIPDTKKYVDQLGFVVTNDHRAVRDMAIAKAVWHEAEQIFNDGQLGKTACNGNLAAIIATLK